MLSFYARGKCNRYQDKDNKFLKKRRKLLRKTSMVKSISLTQNAQKKSRKTKVNIV
jgi:hypothetical protein